MNKKQINTLILLEKLGNITKAADHIGIAQPTLSKFLSNLEKELKVKIFYRRPRSIEVTKEGEIYLQTFKNILNLLDKADKNIASLRNELIDEFTIAIHPVLGKFILPKIEKYLETIPSISLSYSFKNSREATQDILEGRADFGLIADTQEYPDLIIKLLWREYIGLYSLDGMPKEKLLFNSNMIFANKLLNKITFKQKTQVNNYSVIYEILKKTQSMGLLPNPIAESEAQLKLIKKFKPTVNVSLVYRADRVRSKSMTKVISIIQETSKA